MKKVVFVILYLISTQLMAGSWIFKAGNTFGFNPQEMYLWDYKVEHRVSNGIYLGAGYEFPIAHHFSLSINPLFEQHHGDVSINNIKAEGYFYNIRLPLHLSYTLKDKWQFLSGISIQNYMEFHDFALTKSYNLRYNLDIGIIYHFTKIWAMELEYSYMLSERVDALLLKNYSNHISLGLQINFSHAFKKKK